MKKELSNSTAKSCQISRRKFVAGAVTMAVASRMGAYAFSKNEESPESEAGLTIIDTHVHFYDPGRPVPKGRETSISWPGPNSNLYKKTLPPDWEKIAKPIGMNGTVVVEASNWFEDNDWILNLAKDYKYIVGFVGNLTGTAIENGNAVSVWDDLNRYKLEAKRLSKDPLFLGMRVGGKFVGSDLTNGRYPHYEVFADLGLMVDTLGVPAADVVSLAKSIPSLTIVVDHMNNIRGSENPSDQWKADMKLLSGPKNVVMKVSGLVEGFSTTQTDATEALKKCHADLDLAYELFGDDRLVFGTNWPVSEPKGQMPVVKDIIYNYFSPKGKDLLAKVFAGNAKRVYKYVKR